jgi:hypothetical protein
MTVDLRDYFAARCSRIEIERRLGDGLGAIRMHLIRRKMIPADRAQLTEVGKSFTYHDVQQLRCAVRYEYADDMMNARARLP